MEFGLRLSQLKQKAFSLTPMTPYGFKLDLKNCDIEPERMCSTEYSTPFT